MKKILLIADTPGWIFHRHCDEIKKRMTEYEFTTKFTWQNPFTQEEYNNYDLVYQLDPMSMHGHYPPKNKNVMGLRNEFMYDHSTAGLIHFFKTQIEPRCSVFHVVNKNQLREFSSIPLTIPLFLVQHGVDTYCFKVKDKKSVSTDGPLVVGISGSPNSSGEKGFHLAQEACNITGCQVLTAMQNLSGTHLTKEQMSDYYNKIDIFCCMSKTEGLNNCIMESGATGVPVITTKTGAVEEMIDDGKNGFLIERSISALVEKINFFKNNRQLIKSFGESFMETIIKNWSWDVKIKDYRRLFDSYFKII